MPGQIGMRRVVERWFLHLPYNMDKNKKTDGTVITYFSNPICRWNDSGTFSITTAGYIDSKTTKSFIHHILMYMFGNAAPFLYKAKDGKFYLHDALTGNNAVEWNNHTWYEFVDTQYYRRS
jgi:hypothetical protein